MPEDLKVGVFICECGGNISDTVDIQKVKDSLNVEVVEQFVNLCSLNGRKRSFSNPQFKKAPIRLVSATSKTAS